MNRTIARQAVFSGLVLALSFLYRTSWAVTLSSGTLSASDPRCLTPLTVTLTPATIITAPIPISTAHDVLFPFALQIRNNNAVGCAGSNLLVHYPPLVTLPIAPGSGTQMVLYSESTQGSPLQTNNIQPGQVLTLQVTLGVHPGIPSGTYPMTYQVVDNTTPNSANDGMASSAKMTLIVQGGSAVLPPPPPPPAPVIISTKPVNPPPPPVTVSNCLKPVTVSLTPATIIAAVPATSAGIATYPLTIKVHNNNPAGCPATVFGIRWPAINSRTDPATGNMLPMVNFGTDGSVSQLFNGLAAGQSVNVNGKVLVYPGAASATYGALTLTVLDSPMNGMAGTANFTLTLHGGSPVPPPPPPPVTDSKCLKPLTVSLTPSTMIVEPVAANAAKPVAHPFALTIHNNNDFGCAPSTLGITFPPAPSGHAPYSMQVVGNNLSQLTSKVVEGEILTIQMDMLVNPGSVIGTYPMTFKVYDNSTPSAMNNGMAKSANMSVIIQKSDKDKDDAKAGKDSKN